MQSKLKRWIVAALPLAMACSAFGQSKVTDVSTRSIDGGLAVHIGGNELAKPTTKWDGGALVLTFQASLGAHSKTMHPNTGGIKAIAFAKHGANVEVAVRPSASKNPQIVKVADGWLVYFEDELTMKLPSLGSGLSHKDGQFQKQTFAPVNPRDFKSKALVTLNFVDTDIQQIIKALAMQANVNVAMGSDVAGKITINLDNVPVDEALDLVTTLGGVRYLYQNNTYVVCSTSRYGEMSKGLSHGNDFISETRVVPLFSREGTQIKAAMLKMVPTDTAAGKYELVLPSEKVSLEQMQMQVSSSGQASAATGGSGDKGGDKGAAQAQVGAQGQGTKVDQKSSDDTNKKDDYIVLVGSPERMDQIEKAVRSIDVQICAALGLKVGTSQAPVQRTYEPKGALAVDLLKSLIGADKGEYDGVKIVATPGVSASKQAIVVSGHEADVDRVIAILANLDSAPDTADTIFEVVDLKFVRPNYVWSQLTQNIPGLKASFLPPPIDPLNGIDYSEEGVGSGGKSNGGSGSSGGGDNGSGSGGGSGSSGGGGSSSGGSSGGGSGGSGGGASGSSGTSLGTNGQANTSVSTSTKANTFPMKLMLRGTREQIAAAKQYIAMVDLAPRQVAIELRVMELSHEDALKVGLDWSVLTGGTLQSIHINQNPFGDDTNPGNLKGGLKFPGGGTLGILGALDQISNKNNVLARPSILVDDGVPTDIFIGDEVRYVKSITSSQNGPTVITDEIDVGVDFSVIARIGAEGNIMLNLAPTLKVLEGFTPVPGGGNLPQTSRRSAQSQMSIKSGETIAIGGLIQEQDKKNYAGIPILKDLPLIGRLFGRTSNDKIRSEVVFFVTVREVTPADRAGAANPRKAEQDNKDWPGNKDPKKSGG